ncbi:epidermal growth factor receptor isoform X5 [Plutella xylostella]|uniref:epidermal growth factor receptor isoform X5 n=1 Tax=Plutella xylostella TaxID=51655 RepID=UPI002032FF2D|nr:epidermal growth factor receptor isoform X5 [Plutella xylostella]
MYALLLCCLTLASLAPGAHPARPHRHHPPPQRITHHKHSEFVKGKICIGTNGRMSVPSNRDIHYRNLRNRFTNCTYVDGNLELTWLQNDTMDLSFLKYIREVTGYVLISHVKVRRIILPQLQIIRGRTLFKLNVREEEFALMVTMSSAFTLELPALRDVLRGSVGMYNNYNLCHVKTINWDEIITGINATYVYVYNYTVPERECPRCHASCEAGCWGEGPDNCQKFSKTNCSPQCAQGRCFGPNPRDCCNTFCAGGCTGPLPSQCLACRNFFDEGTCSQECPPMQIYNPTTYSWEPNPNGKYAYGATCVRNCPEHLLKDNGACVRSCPPNKTAVNGECIPCNVTCPKTCRAEKPIHAGNIDSFKDCTIIDGSVEILEMTLTGFQQVNSDYSFGERYPKMDPEKLEVFSTVREVTGYLNVQAHHPNFTSLSYFRNLEVIGGRQVAENLFASLYIVKTSLKSLGLKSLKRVNSGAIAIMENKNLCFADKIAWGKLVKSKDHKQVIQKNGDPRACEKANLVCDAECSGDGCWGPGPDQCLSCQNYKFGETCIQNCSVHPGLYKSGSSSCKQCDVECVGGCSGPGPANCTACRHVRDGPYCVAQCPMARYNAADGTCLPCHRNCEHGCTGPENTVGPGACNSCSKAIISVEAQIEVCLEEDEPCPDGYYNEWVGNVKPLEGKVKVVCRKCHPLCKKCTGFGIHQQVCQVCNGFKRSDQCEDECPADHFTDDVTRTCTPCHHECRGCTGPTSTDCIKCHNLKIFINESNNIDNKPVFNCTDACPDHMPHKIYFDEMLQNVIEEPYCSEAPSAISRPAAARTSTVLVLVLVFAFLLLIILAIIGYTCRQKAKAKKDAVKMTMVLTGCEDNEPLRPTNVKPNLAKLRIVKEAELRRGGMLGFGAFGKVYKGVWVPEGENVKIPVAIKVLKEGTGANSSKEFMEERYIISKEFLEEAYIMASVEHPNLLQLLAVCMTSQMMLITQLMPLGCLLDYVRTHREKIGSKAFLNWCTQIARGMSYLEEKRLVHRDLAARNVLVQTPNCVKITDFGLAKLLDINEDEYKAAGGKMPIKWLALECIQHRIFTHKSDVWAFGVTIWEILSYGARPYENISARNVPELIENGLKLSQPAICTLDIYCIMVSCWMLDADSRPTFKQLADTFAEMARDPGRYLVIPGDKFMRLPSYSTQDEKEILRNLQSAMEGPEPLVEADEYLQPKFKPGAGTLTSNSAVSGVDTQTSSLKPSTSTSWANHPGPDCATDGSRPETWDHELLKYNQHPDDRHYYNNNVCASDSSGSRFGDSKTETFESKNKEAQVGNLKLNLPLDEDDYLMPSPQQNQNASTYMDLIGENGEGSDAKDLRFSGFVGIGSKRCVDNPEYLMSEESVPTQTVGIPVECASEASEASEGAGAGAGAEAGAPPYQPQRSLEEESMSDHEYYNDLQRELQPLRRNETTV